MDLNQFAVKFNNPIWTSFTIFTCIIPSFFFLYSTYFLACKWRESNAKHVRVENFLGLPEAGSADFLHWFILWGSARLTGFEVVLRTVCPYATGDWVISQHYIYSDNCNIYKIGKCYSIKIKWKITQLRDGNIKSKNVTL